MSEMSVRDVEGCWMTFGSSFHAAQREYSAVRCQLRSESIFVNVEDDPGMLDAQHTVGSMRGHGATSLVV
jgi:hypothetical protein